MRFRVVSKPLHGAVWATDGPDFSLNNTANAGQDLPPIGRLRTPPPDQFNGSSPGGGCEKPLACARLLLPGDVRRRLGPPRQLQLFQQAADVGLDRVLAQEE